MKYTVETTERFEKEFKRLDRYTQRMLKSWIEKNLVGCENPRAKGKGTDRKPQRPVALPNRGLPPDLSDPRQ